MVPLAEQDILACWRTLPTLVPPDLQHRRDTRSWRARLDSLRQVVFVTGVEEHSGSVRGPKAAALSAGTIGI